MLCLPNLWISFCLCTQVQSESYQKVAFVGAGCGLNLFFVISIQKYNPTQWHLQIANTKIAHCNIKNSSVWSVFGSHNSDKDTYKIMEHSSF